MNRTNGFTLAEAAVAIAVVAILAGIIIPLVRKNLRDARIARARNDINIIAAAIASQMKDTGSSPMADNGPGGSTGLDDAIWFSPGTRPTLVFPANLPDHAGYHHENTFRNLFTAPSPALGAAGPLTQGQANTLFGLAGAPPTAEFRYKGPYLSTQMANSTDPWGGAYTILGYNADGMAGNGGHIWVFSTGASGCVDVTNYAGHWPQPVGGVLLPWVIQPGARWVYTRGSQTNIAVQVQ